MENLILYDNLLINKSSTIYNCIKQIEQNKKQFILCVDDDNSVIGTLTDGDIRRLILNHIDLNTTVEAYCNTIFEFLKDTSSFDIVCEKFKSNKIDFLPILDTNNKLVNLISKKQFHILLLEDLNFDLKSDFSKFDNMVLEHEIYNRPWGFYKSTILSSHAQAKIITVFPHSELSLQEHKRREEHWVIIKGKGQIILGESLIDIYPGKYIYIPKGCKHQVINNTDNNIVFSEVQLGDYFGEDDIIRYSDKYGRVTGN